MHLSQAKRPAVPEGAGVLFFIQTFATLGYAVLQSTLVLYATKHLHFSDQLATALMGVFGAFNYGLHLFGGYLGGRFLSNRNLFVGGMVLQVLGCACIAAGSAAGKFEAADIAASFPSLLPIAARVGLTGTEGVRDLVAVLRTQ